MCQNWNIPWESTEPTKVQVRQSKNERKDSSTILISFKSHRALRGSAQVDMVI